MVEYGPETEHWVEFPSYLHPLFAVETYLISWILCIIRSLVTFAFVCVREMKRMNVEGLPFNKFFNKW